MRRAKRYLLIGHYCPTDATPEPPPEGDVPGYGLLDDGLQLNEYRSLRDARTDALWFPDGVIFDRKTMRQVSVAAE